MKLYFIINLGQIKNSDLGQIKNSDWLFLVITSSVHICHSSVQIGEVQRFGCLKYTHSRTLNSEGSNIHNTDTFAG